MRNPVDHCRDSLGGVLPFWLSHFLANQVSWNPVGRSRAYGKTEKSLPSISFLLYFGSRNFALIELICCQPSCSSESTISHMSHANFQVDVPETKKLPMRKVRYERVLLIELWRIPDSLFRVPSELLSTKYLQDEDSILIRRSSFVCRTSQSFHIASFQLVDHFISPLAVRFAGRENSCPHNQAPGGFFVPRMITPPSSHS